MGVLSKPLFSIIDGCFGQSGPRLVEGFNTKYGEDFRDVHFWCEDAHGKVYDTTPIPPHPSGSTQFAYLSWDNQGKCFDEYSNPAWESFFRVNKKLTDTPTARIRIAEAIFRVGDYSSPLQCHMNSHAMASLNPNLKVVVGSLGYKLAPGIVEINWGQ